jgi:hypothetical protein
MEIFLAPILLKGRFLHDKYYDHMLRLVNIMKTTLQFETMFNQLNKVNEEIIDWVEDYER